MPRSDIISLSSHPFAYWPESLGSLSDKLRNSNKKTFVAKHPHAFLVLANRPASSLESEWVESETELSKLAGSMGPEARGFGEHAAEVVKANRNAREPRIMLGRAQGNDIIIRSSKVSKLHLAFEQDTKRHYQVIDMGSSNGSWVNRKQLKKGQLVKLKGGETITIWRYQFLFLLPDGLVRLLKQL